VQANATAIKINYEEENAFHLINIIDDGKGIEAEVANKIFDADFTTKVKGMGLGLSMAKNFLESINGSILLKETSNNGTTIQLKFPKI
jgi:two-component system sensor histidine kinase FlrB